MKYVSTREQLLSTGSNSLIEGIGADGGLYVPENIPRFSIEEIKGFTKLSYAKKAARIISAYLPEYSQEELERYAEAAYTEEQFTKGIATVKNIDDNLAVLELFHGPTCAFKDFALQLLPSLLSAALDKNNDIRTPLILAATSGDTGKAALEGFSNEQKSKICVFYPNGGVSEMQKKQMATQDGENVNVFSIKGNFDDAQQGVKNLFADKAFLKQLYEGGYFVTSANSINWGRLVSQIVYYFSAYCDMVDMGMLEMGEGLNIVVPTGNFGNILAGYIAKISGLPMKKIVCASNANNVLTEFINTGVYDSNRQFFKTISPSMDILVSSNLERLLYLLGGSTKTLMGELKTTGRYQVSNEIFSKISEHFKAGFASDEESFEAIKSAYEKYGYLADPHTAVGLKVYYESQLEGKSLVVSTANPYKFAPDVLKALSGEEMDDLTAIDRLESITGILAPKTLTSLKDKKERFNSVIGKESEDMKKAILDWLNL